MKTNTTNTITVQPNSNPILVRYSDTQVYTGLFAAMVLLSLVVGYLWKKLP